MTTVYLIESSEGKWDIIGPKGNRLNNYPFRGIRLTAMKWGIAYMSFMDNIIVEFKDV